MISFWNGFMNMLFIRNYSILRTCKLPKAGHKVPK